MLPTNKILFTIADFCAIAGCSRKTFYNWKTAGKAPQPVLIGNSARIHRDDLEAWLNGLKTSPTIH